MLRTSLRWKLTLPMLFAVALFGFLSIYLWSSRYETELLGRFESDGLRSTTLFGETVATALWEFDQARAEKILHGFNQWDGFTYADVRDPQGVFVAHARADAPMDDLTTVVDGFDLNTTTRAEANGLIFFIVPLRQENHGVIGHLVAGFSLDQVKQQVEMVHRDGVILIAISFGLMGALLLLLAESVIRPLTRATAMIDRLANGDLEFQPTDTQRSDEVGRIARAVDVFRRNAADLVSVTARASADRQIAAMALVDDLTGLPNRRALKQKVAELCAGSDTEPRPTFAVLHMDLDGFKEINDTLGHPAGDAILKRVARRLEQTVSQSVFCARVGGDEFVAILSADHPCHTAEVLAQRMLDAFNTPFEYGGQSLWLGCSIGLARCRAFPDLFSEALVNADIALYRAKDEGKNCYVVFTEAHRTAVLARKALTDDLLRAVDQDEFVPFFQPQVDAASGELVGAEVLARWQHPERGLLTPNEFLPLSEELNIMRLIDQKLFNLAVAQFMAWNGEGVRLPKLGFNISAKRLFDPLLPVMLKKVRETSLGVNIELLESVLLDDASDQLLTTLKEIRGMGVGIQIDDFGTGHASVAGLLKVAPDALKLDRRFVLSAPSSPRDLNVLALLIQIAKTLGTVTIAEGVETEAHAALMRELGADVLQGYAFGRPMPAEALRPMLTALPRAA